MPVNSTHKEYDTNSAKWARIRAVVDGTDAVKAAGTEYLPKPNGHTGEDYAGYKIRAEFYPATQRTVDGLLGAVFRKEPMLEVPKGQETILENTTLRGLDFTNFAKMVVRETLTLGRYGVLVDVMDGDNMPFASGYCAENILNWRYTFVNRKPVLTLVVLAEMATKSGAEDEWQTEAVERFRVLQLGQIEGDSTGAMVYVQRLFEKTINATGTETIAEIEQIVPLRRGERLDRIPFTFFSPLDLTASVEKSPLIDLVDVNLSHYRTSAELEEGAYFTGLPMYVISGRPQGEAEVTEFAVGSRTALMLEEGGDAKVLTVDGQGMGLLQGMMEDKEKRMAVLGARILEDQKAGVEAAATVSMRHRGENSMLGSVSDTCSRGLKSVLEDMVWWNGVNDPEVQSDLNKDFISAQLSPKELVELTAAYQQGAFGPEVFFKALKDGERIPNEWTKDDWLADVEEGASLFEKDLMNEDPGDNVVPLKKETAP